MGEGSKTVSNLKKNILITKKRLKEVHNNQIPKKIQHKRQVFHTISRTETEKDTKIEPKYGQNWHKNTETKLHKIL